MLSFVEPFKQLFEEQGIGTIHTRSTFLIALPALIAARQLGLKVLYEVSGLWELVYQDREDESHLLKRSPFAELAETITMTRADRLVVMNDAVRQIAIDRGVSAERIHVAHNAVDIENFKPMEPAKNETFTIGYLGSFLQTMKVWTTLLTPFMNSKRKMYISMCSWWGMGFGSTTSDHESSMRA